MERNVTHKLMSPALKVAEMLAPLSSGKLPQEVLILDAETISIVAEIDGVDYFLSMMRVPRQRTKPATQ